MSKKYKDVIIIGAGPAGLSLSYFLQKQVLSHLVFEKSRPCSQWFDRFDRFQMNTANWMNRLPGASELFEDKNHLQRAQHQLATGVQILEYMQQYSAVLNPPMQMPCSVTDISYLENYSWKLNTSFSNKNAAVTTFQ